jgi:dipeptidase
MPQKNRLRIAVVLSACLLISSGTFLPAETPVTQQAHISKIQNNTPVVERCSSLIVGRKATAEGSVILAHNEDLSNYSAQHYVYVPHKEHEEGEFVVTFDGARVPQVPETYAYIATEIFDMNYSPGQTTSGINEHQVAVVNNMSYRRDPEPDPSEGRIIWTEFTRFALERAKTAAEAVQIIGHLASTYKLGYDTGTIFGVTDPSEGWWVEVTQEGQWVAQRVPDDSTGFRANIFRIGEVAFDDPENFMYSEDLVSYARSKGWYRSGPFNFMEIYGDPVKVASQYNKRREWRAGALLRRQLPSIKPEHIMAIWRDHYEGTPYDLTNGYTKGSPHQTDERTLCSISTEVSVICQSRGWLPAEIGALCWRAMGTPCTSIYTPWYLGGSTVPKEYQTGTNQFTKNSAYWTFRYLSLSADIRYGNTIQKLTSDTQAFEKNEMESQAHVEETAVRLYAQDKARLQEYLSKHSAALAQKAMAKGNRLIEYCGNH